MRVTQTRSTLCCHSNETCALIANPPNNAQLDGTPCHSSNLHPDPCSSVWMCQGTDTQTRMTNIHFVSSVIHEKCNEVDAFTFRRWTRSLVRCTRSTLLHGSRSRSGWVWWRAVHNVASSAASSWTTSFHWRRSATPRALNCELTCNNYLCISTEWPKSGLF